MEGAGLGIREDRGGVRIWKKAWDGDQMKFGKKEQWYIMIRLRGGDGQSEGSHQNWCGPYWAELKFGYSDQI